MKAALTGGPRGGLGGVVGDVLVTQVLMAAFTHHAHPAVLRRLSAVRAQGSNVGGSWGLLIGVLLPSRRSVRYSNNALAALDDFYVRLGLGKANVGRDELPKTAPEAMDASAEIRWLRAV